MVSLKLWIVVLAGVPWGFACPATLAAQLAGGDTAAGAPGVRGAERPRFELRPGEKYFRVDGRPAFVLGRNPAGTGPQAYDDHFRHVAAAGERFVRIHFTFIPRDEKPGQIDPGMLQAWDRILDSAERHGLGVLPVLGVWADWNDGSNRETWHRWDQNPYNLERGGPAQRPRELFDDTPCRRLWLKRLETFVSRWSRRPAIVAWEIFSELDLVSGATEPAAVRFVDCAARTIRAADPWRRPITASQAGVDEWPALLRSSSLDFIEIHPYTDGALGGRLDNLILTTVRARLAKYGKPVLLGESGLSSAPPRATLDVAPRAEVGIRHAIWASLVSGAMNGRMLWWQDGYDRFEQADLCGRYQQAAATAAAFVQGADFTGFAPVACQLSAGLKGAVVGNSRLRLAWFRDARCEPPGWPTKPLAGEIATIDAPGSSWQVEFFDPVAGASVGKRRVGVHDRRLRLALGEFQGSIAVRLTRLDP